MNQKFTSAGPIQMLQDTINQFIDQYGMACIKCVIIKEDEPYLYLADITIQHKNDTPIEEKIQEYDNIILAVVPLTLNELKTLVGEMESGQIHLKSLGAINAKNSLQNNHDYVSSWTHYNGYYYDWPCYCFRASLDKQDPFRGMRDPIVKTGLPAYPNVFEACNAFFQHRETPTQYDAICINFLIPDYGARINELKIDGKEILVSIESKELVMDNLVVQILCKRRDNRYQHSRDLRSGDGRLKFSADFAPNEVFVYLLDSKNDRRIDSKIFDPYHSSMTDGITVATSVKSLENMIAGGENQHAEFKYGLDKGDAEFLESVVSFANTNSGRILLGVNDDGTVVGSFEDFAKIDKRIRGLISSRCEPDVAIKVEQVDLGGRSIIVVHVEEGKDKPYILVGKSAYKRIGKDDRVFTRHDFDKIMNKRLAVANMQYETELLAEDRI